MPQLRIAFMEQLAYQIGDALTLLETKNILTELLEIRRLYTHMEDNGQGLYSTDILDELQKKAGRLIQYETVHTFLQDQSNELLKIQSCVQLYQCAFKASDRETIINTMKSILDRLDTRKEMETIPGDAKEKVAELTSIYSSVKTSTLPESVKDTFTAKLQGIGNK